MNKIWIVLKSEFLRRVQSKWFVIATLLAPVVMIGLAVVPGLLAVVAVEGNERTVAVIDETGVLLPRLQEVASEQTRFEGTGLPVDSVRAAVEAGLYDGYLLLPGSIREGEGAAVYFSVTGGGLSLHSRIEDAVNRVVESYRLAEENASPEVLEILQSRVSVRMVKLTEEGEAEDSAIASSIVGYIMGFIIYGAMFIYGAFVMQGVMEEKTSRVVEVMVSSVKPFHLLMGKVLGIGAMGLLQMVLWSLLMLAGMAFSGTLMAFFLDPAQLNLPVGATEQEMLEAANFSIPALSPLIFVWFVLFFLGGYLLYASLFAAVGSAVEQQQDAQGLMFPITLLIIVPIIFMSFLIESPNSTLSTVLSIIPFFSPILMVVRVAVTEVPLWEILLSLVLLFGTFVGAVWLSGRIYRVGILMYGKKPSIADLIRWMRYA